MRTLRRKEQRKSQVCTVKQKRVLLLTSFSACPQEITTFWDIHGNLISNATGPTSFIFKAKVASASATLASVVMLQWENFKVEMQFFSKMSLLSFSLSSRAVDPLLQVYLVANSEQANFPLLKPIENSAFIPLSICDFRVVVQKKSFGKTEFSRASFNLKIVTQIKSLWVVLKYITISARKKISY